MIFRRKDPLVLAYTRLVLAFAKYHDTGNLVLPNSIFSPRIERMLNESIEVLAGVETTRDMRSKLCALFDGEFRRFGLVPKDQVAPSILGRLCMTYIVTESDVRGLSFPDPWEE